jgi:transmembrane sensor
MDPASVDPKAEPTAEAAASWFVRLQDPEAGADEWQAFEAWLAARPANAETYARVERLWVGLERDAETLSAQMGGPFSGTVAGERRRPPRRVAAPTRRAALVGGAIAAGLAVAATSVALWPERPRTEVYATRPGETRRVTLSDGTRVQLEAASTVRVSFARNVRRVEMADAEAVFDVAHDPARPFIISVGDREVKVVGTEFNLRRRDGHTALTVRRGVVEVRPAAAATGPATRVAAGQQLKHRDGDIVSHVSTVAPDAAFAWTTGQLVYREAPLSEIAGDLSRRLAVPIRVADAKTANLRVSGVLVIDREADVLRRLQAYAPISAERRPDGIVLRSRSKAP